MLLRARILGLILILIGGRTLANGQDAVVSFDTSGDPYATADQLGGWRFTAEALGMQRASGPLVTSSDTTGTTIEQALAGDSLQPGMRFQLQRFGAGGSNWELSYFGLLSGTTAETLLGDPVFFSRLVHAPNLRLDDDIGGFDSSIGYSYQQQLQNAELNRWTTQHESNTWNLQWLLGARYFSFEERLQMEGADSIFGSEFLDAASSNYLIGGQLGGRVERSWDRCSVFAVGKVGLLGNAWKHRLRDVVIPTVGFPLPDIDTANRDVGLAGLLDGQIGLRYRLNDRIGIRCGYNLWYVAGVAIQTTGEPDQNPFGNLFLHGVSAGCDISW